MREVNVAVGVIPADREFSSGGAGGVSDGRVPEVPVRGEERLGVGVDVTSGDDGQGPQIIRSPDVGGGESPGPHATMIEGDMVVGVPEDSPQSVFLEPLELRGRERVVPAFKGSVSQ